MLTITNKRKKWIQWKMTKRVTENSNNDDMHNNKNK